MIAAVTRAGYGASVRRDSGCGARRATRRASSATIAALRREFVVAAMLTVPLLAQMVPMLASGGLVRSRRTPTSFRAGWQLVLATPVQFWIGRRFYVGAWHALRGGGANMDVLVVLGTTMAWAFSAVVTVLGLHQHVYFEAGAAVITLVLLGKLLEARAKAGTSAALEGLLRLQPKIAHVLRDGATSRRSAGAGRRRRSLRRSRRGEHSGRRRRARRHFERRREHADRREHRPCRRAAGAKVFAGTLNQDGMLTCEATGVGNATLLAGIVRLVAEAQGSKAPIQRLADRVSGIFVPVVVVIAALTFALTWWLAGDATHALVQAVAVLVIACPCALGLATPTAIMVGTGRGAQSGILIRNASALEQAGRLQTLIVDKTGTLTEGRPVVTDVIAFGGASRAEVLRAAASLEQGSTHPLAKAVLAAARARRHRSGADRATSCRCRARASQGRSGGRRRTLPCSGSLDYLADNGVDRSARGFTRRCSRDGKTMIGVATGGRALGVIALADAVRPSSARAVARLEAAGIDVVMLTGDNAATAQAVARGGRHREFPRGRPARGQGRSRARVEGARRGDRHGRRRRQRRAGAGRGRRELRDRRGRRTSPSKPPTSRSIRNDLDAVVDAILLSRATLAQDPPEPVLRVRLQRARHSAGGGRAAESGDRRRGDGRELGIGRRQRAAAQALAARRPELSRRRRRWKRITMNVQGMTCGGCVASVTRVLKAVPGVSRRRGDAAARRGEGDVRSGAHRHAPALRAAIEDAGYDVVA